MELDTTGGNVEYDLFHMSATMLPVSAASIVTFTIVQGKEI